MISKRRRLSLKPAMNMIWNIISPPCYPTPMPPNAHVKEDDIKTLVQWVLATK